MSETAIELPSSCHTDGCGRPRFTAGRPKLSWWNLHSGSDKGIWFCSKDCVARYLEIDIQQADDPTVNQYMQPWEALKVLNRIAGRYVAVWEITPEKLEMLMQRAFAELKQLVERDCR